jgi:DNA-binding NarL/FixJ family response regulator
LTSSLQQVLPNKIPMRYSKATGSPLRLLLADDHEIVRQGLRAILEACPNCQVVGEAVDGHQAMAMTKELNPDIVILDLAMPSLNGLDATRQILELYPHTKVLVLTMHESDSVIREVLDAGARGYILKTDAGRDLVAAVESLRRNKTFFTSRVSQMILDGFLKREHYQDSPSGAVRLTPRQRQIVQLLAEGKSSKEIGVALDLSVKTAETHRANIMRKLDCHSVTEVVRYAIRNKIIEA